MGRIAHQIVSKQDKLRKASYFIPLRSSVIKSFVFKSTVTIYIINIL